MIPAVEFKRRRRSKQVYEFIGQHPEGVTRTEIFDHIFGDDPDGGTIGGDHDTWIWINTLNRKLKPHDLVVVGSKHNGVKRYTLRRISTGNIWLPI